MGCTWAISMESICCVNCDVLLCCAAPVKDKKIKIRINAKKSVNSAPKVIIRTSQEDLNASASEANICKQRWECVWAITGCLVLQRRSWSSSTLLLFGCFSPLRFISLLWHTGKHWRPPFTFFTIYGLENSCVLGRHGSFGQTNTHAHINMHTCTHMCADTR